MQKCGVNDPKQVSYVAKAVVAASTKNEAFITEQTGSKPKVTVRKLYEEILVIVNQANSPLDTKIIDQIKCDLARTNTTDRVKTKEGQQELENVLMAIAFLFPQVGYCQGMNFIASMLLMIMDN